MPAWSGDEDLGRIVYRPPGVKNEKLKSNTQQVLLKTIFTKCSQKANLRRFLRKDRKFIIFMIFLKIHLLWVKAGR